MIRSYCIIRKVAYLNLRCEYIGNKGIFLGQAYAPRSQLFNTYCKPNNKPLNFKQSIATLPSVPYSTNMSTFKLSDYYCIGFDLDHTLLRYNITNLVLMEYDILSKYLVREKGYNSKYLLKPLTKDDLDFMQKGLVLDFERGNILRLNPSGKILRATHGTKLLTEEEINNIYPECRWSVTEAFCKDMLSTWNGPMSMQMRSLLDYFDFPSSIIFGKIIDTLDEEHGKPLDQYNVWPDMLEGFIYMFDRKQFELDDGEFFPIMKSNPAQYLQKCSPQTIHWLQEIKKYKKTFLITGSNVDFADFTATYALGKDWKSLFDIVIFYAKKPGFFVEKRPFLKIIDLKEHDKPVEPQELEQDQFYSQGNWKGLMQFLAQVTNMNEPKCLYFGDNLVQDIFVPNKCCNWDTVAVIKELMLEGKNDEEILHRDDKILNSKIWGSFFGLSGLQEDSESLWSHIIHTHAKLCVPDIELISQNSIEICDTKLHGNGRKYCSFYPNVFNRN